MPLKRTEYVQMYIFSLLNPAVMMLGLSLLFTNVTGQRTCVISAFVHVLQVKELEVQKRTN